MIPFKNRFHGHNSLNYVYKNGRAIKGHTLTIKFVKNPRNKQIRAAVVISKKTLKSAVKRNLIRRRLYEYIREKLSEFNGVYDIVFIVTSSEIINLNNQERRSQIDPLIAKSGMLKNTNGVQKTTWTAIIN